MGEEVDLSPPPIRDVRVALGRPEVGVAEHLLDAAQVGASFEQVRREGVAEEMRVDAGRVEPGPVRELAEDEEGARAGQRATPRVQEELGPVAPVEVGPPEREVAPHGFRRRAPEGTIRSFPPFPTTRTIRSSMSTPIRSRPIASETRRPAP